MPATPPTIRAPLPTDPRIMSLAKSVGLPRREAFAVAAEAWAWMSVMEVGGLVKKTPPDSLDGLVDVEGFGHAMLQAGLVGVVDDSLVLPAELRHHEADQGESRRRAAAVSEEEKADRRREQNRESARRCRATAKLTRPAAAPAPSSKPKWRSLGRAAGHEVRVFDGPHGVYASVLNATLNGKACKKLTAGDKGWSLESVRLVDVLPGLVEKAQTLTRSGPLGESLALTPAPADLEEAAAREQIIAAFREGESADQGSRHADASACQQRQHDASASVSKTSASTDAESEPNANGDNELPRQQTSASGDADAPSSSLSSSKSSSSLEEEDMEREGREGREGSGSADADLPPALQEKLREQDRKREEVRAVAARIGEALGMEPESVVRMARTNPSWLSLQCQQHGIDPRTGFRIDAGGSHEAPDARAAIDMTTEPAEQDKPATGIVEPRGHDEHDEADEGDHNSLSKVEKLQRACGTIRAAAAIGAEGSGLSLKLIDANVTDEEDVQILPVALR